MIEMLLVVTCVIGSGERWTPPQGWAVTGIASSGQRPVCFGSVCYAIEHEAIKDTSVTMQRPIAAGEAVKIPDGCKGSVTRQEAQR